MKTTLFIILTLISVTSCTNSFKEQSEAVAATPMIKENKAVSEFIEDKYGDRMEVIRFENKKKITVKLGGKTYELRKDFENTGFSTHDNMYQLTETKYEITFMKKDINMVMFHSKKLLDAKKMAAQ